MGHTLLFGGIEMLAGAYKPAAQIHPQLVPLGFTDEDELQSDPFDGVVEYGYDVLVLEQLAVTRIEMDLPLVAIDVPSGSGFDELR